MGQFAEGVAELGFPFAIFFAWMTALTEFFGGILIASGLGTRVAAGFLFINMAVAAFLRHAPDPFGRKNLRLRTGWLPVRYCFSDRVNIRWTTSSAAGFTRKSSK